MPEEQSVTLIGDFVTRVFEGPYREIKTWYGEMQKLANAPDDVVEEIYFFYTTCPKCAKAYDENYIIGVARTR